MTWHWRPLPGTVTSGRACGARGSASASPLPPPACTFARRRPRPCLTSSSRNRTSTSTRGATRRSAIATCTEGSRARTPASRSTCRRRSSTRAASSSTSRRSPTTRTSRKRCRPASTTRSAFRSRVAPTFSRRTAADAWTSGRQPVPGRIPRSAPTAPTPRPRSTRVWWRSRCTGGGGRMGTPMGDQAARTARSGRSRTRPACGTASSRTCSARRWRFPTCSRSASGRCGS